MAATTDPWANFVAPTDTLGAEITGISTVVETEVPTVAGTEAPTSAVTEAATAEVTLTIPPTPLPTVAYVARTCSDIGGNVCLANEDLFRGVYQDNR